MKKMCAAAFVLVAFTLGGCGKKKDAKKITNPTVAENALNEEKKLAKQEVPIYSYEEDKFFDENQVGDFAFIDDESNSKAGKKGKFSTAQNEEEPLTAEAKANSQFKTVRFDLNRNVIRPDQRPAVVKNASVAKATTKDGKNVLVVGHCCQLGSTSFNLSLSEQRAKTIRDEMVKAGVPEDQIKIIGAGSECPIVVSDASDRATLIKDLAANRRAEVSLS